MAQYNIPIDSEIIRRAKRGLSKNGKLMPLNNIKLTKDNKKVSLIKAFHKSH